MMAGKSKVKKTLLSRIKEVILFLLLAVALGWAIDAWRSQSLPAGSAPKLIATSVQGEKIDLQALSQDQPVILYFWAIWCPVCSAVTPSIDFMADYYPVVSVALSSGDDQRIRQYLRAKEYEVSVVNDPKGAISRDWTVSVTPTIFIIDKGEIRSVTTGFTSPFGIWLRLLIS